jgi:penicillin-binding protein 2
MLAKLTDRCSASELILGGSPCVVGHQRRAPWRIALVTCGDPGSVAKADVCWNGSPYQPVPVADDVDRTGRAADHRAARGLSRRCSPSSRACAPTPAPSASTWRTCWATSARSPRTSTTSLSERIDRSLNGASVPSVAPGSRSQYDRWLRGRAGLPSAWRVDSMGRVLGDDSSCPPAQPGDTLVTSIDAKVQGVVEQQLARDRCGTQRTGRSSTR